MLLCDGHRGSRELHPLQIRVMHKAVFSDICSCRRVIHTNVCADLLKIPPYNDSCFTALTRATRSVTHDIYPATHELYVLPAFHAMLCTLHAKL